MLKGICIDKGGSIALVEGNTYYLFPNGEAHYYVSKFPTEGTHFGCYQADQFYILESEESEVKPVEPPKIEYSLDRNKVYKGTLVYRGCYPASIVKFGDYYIKPYKTHGDYYADIYCKKQKGCFPLHWFENIHEVTVPEIQQNVHEFMIKDPKQERIDRLSKDIESFHIKSGSDEEECLDYLRNIAPIIKRINGPEKGQVGVYEFTCKEGTVQVYKDGMKVDLYKYEQLTIDNFLFA